VNKHTFKDYYNAFKITVLSYSTSNPGSRLHQSLQTAVTLSLRRK